MNQKILQALAESLRSGRTTRSTVRGNCMNPLLLDGDQLEIAAAGFVRCGEIIVFCEDGLLVAHRVVQLSQDRIRTKGDASAKVEELTREQVLGKVVGAWRDGRKLPGVTGRVAAIYSFFLPWSRYVWRAVRRL